MQTGDLFPLDPAEAQRLLRLRASQLAVRRLQREAEVEDGSSFDADDFRDPSWERLEAEALGTRVQTP